MATENATLTTGLNDDRSPRRGSAETTCEDLLRNAVEHGGVDVSIIVVSLVERFYVEDDSLGIPEGDLETVFEMRYLTREEGTQSRLSIAKQVAEAHNWEIRVAPSSEGGSRFEIPSINAVVR